MNTVSLKKFLEQNPDVQKMFNDFMNGEGMNRKFKWVCTSDDGYEEDSEKDNHKTFFTQEECYEDMREHAINKIFWNTEWSDVNEDCETFRDKDGIIISIGEMDTNGKHHSITDNWGIGYRMEFHPNMIQHHSYSGLYTYKIVRV